MTLAAVRREKSEKRQERVGQGNASVVARDIEERGCTKPRQQQKGSSLSVVLKLLSSAQPGWQRCGVILGSYMISEMC